MEQLNLVDVTSKLAQEVEKIIVGKRKQIDYIIMAILSDGHILLDDLPGSGKTTLIKTLSIALGCDFKRIQFTPDLLPSDIIGMNIFNQKIGDFQFVEGPVNTNILLADEINRAIPRTQSALLEAMEEKQVTVDSVSYKLPEPFIVMATQNPVESESTFKLPAAQMDRFIIKLSLGYPSPEEEVLMLTNLGDRTPFENVNTVISMDQLLQLQKEIEKVNISDDIKKYIVTLVHKTRENKNLKNGASPRASRSLFRCAKAYAAMNGRDYATPDDIKEIAVPVLAHRITLASEAKFSGTTAENIIEKLLEEVPVPPVKDDIFNAK